MRSRTPRPALLLQLAALAVLFVPACGGGLTPTQPTPQPQETVTPPREGFLLQSGLVLDFRTNAPMPGARVAFSRYGEGAPSYSGLADAHGRYRIEVPPDWYTIHVDDVQLTGFSVRSSSTRAHLFARAEGCSAVYGTVDDDHSGQPLAGVSVTIGPRTATSGADGWYRLDVGCGVNLGFNTMFAYYSHDGYEQGSHVVGRGAPQGALRIDMALTRTGD